MIETARAFIEGWTSENVHVSKKEREIDPSLARALAAACLAEADRRGLSRLSINAAVGDPFRYIFSALERANANLASDPSEHQDRKFRG
jgi:hypothetical protein